jgi:hypothetical protein
VKKSSQTFSRVLNTIGDVNNTDKICQVIPELNTKLPVTTSGSLGTEPTVALGFLVTFAVEIVGVGDGVSLKPQAVEEPLEPDPHVNPILILDIHRGRARRQLYHGCQSSPIFLFRSSDSGAWKIPRDLGLKLAENAKGLFNALLTHVKNM